MDIINFQINDNLSEKKTKKEININKKEKRKLKNQQFLSFGLNNQKDSSRLNSQRSEIQND